MGAKQRKGGKAPRGARRDEQGDTDAPTGPNKMVIGGLTAGTIVAVLLLLGGGGGGGSGGDDDSGALPDFQADRIDLNKRHLPDPLEVMRQVYNVTVLHEDPTILQIDDFLTKAECKHIVKISKSRMERSTAGLERATDMSRTSSTGWLLKQSDLKDKTVNAIQDRIAALTNTPALNQEHFQVLNYKVGQYYKGHHDYIPEQANFPSGVRLATFFMYLSDVAGGGGTQFVNLDLIARPKLGRAVLWYDALYNNRTGNWDMDERTMHEAMPVTKGQKWATNKWIHVNDFVTPYMKGDSA